MVDGFAEPVGFRSKPEAIMEDENDANTVTPPLERFKFWNGLTDLFMD
jgi:hypothetical protein